MDPLLVGRDGDPGRAQVELPKAFAQPHRSVKDAEGPKGLCAGKKGALSRVNSKGQPLWRCPVFQMGCLRTLGRVGKIVEGLRGVGSVDEGGCLSNHLYVSE